MLQRVGQGLMQNRAGKTGTIRSDLGNTGSYAVTCRNSKWSGHIGYLLARA